MSVPDSEPEAVGLKTTETVQLAPGPSVPLQVLDETEKLAPLAPPKATTIAVPLPAATPPPFVTVNVWLALVAPTTVPAKPKLVGEIERVAGARPVPVSEAEAVPPEMPVTASVPLVGPTLVGAKVTPIIQLALEPPPAPRASPLQPSLAIVNPEAALMEVASALVAAPPVLVTVKTCGLPDVPTRTGSNDWLLGVTVMAPGLTPLPCKVAVTVPPAEAVTTRLAVLAPAVVGAKRTVMRQSLPTAIAAVHPLGANEN
ncbi:MAG TPA: hypothetical protein VFG23_18065 [Polyangia bacterium]|nr:hypothetical protein [Polyangia bacterium]